MFQKNPPAGDNHPDVSDAADSFETDKDISLQLPLFPEEILPLGENNAPKIDANQRRDDLVAMLREANEHLICATLAAQDLQIKAEIAKKKQDEFLAMMAHELRNPLAPIASAADLLKLIPNLPASATKVQQTIARQTRHLSYLVDELLDAARLSNGTMRVTLELIDLAGIVENAVETSQPAIDQKQQQLRLEWCSEPVYLWGDPIRLTQAFSNLLLNASKFSDEGTGIELSAHVTATEITVLVRDEGMGISAEFLPQVFDLFTQAPQGLARTKGGLGIGLCLVRSILGEHGGTIHVYSAGTGCGSEFTVRLPRAFPGQ